MKYTATLLAAAALALPAGIMAAEPVVPVLFREVCADPSLRLDASDYTTKTMTVEGRKVVFRAYENLSYVARPVDQTYQTMNIYVPEGYFKGETIHGYTAETAPIFLPNTVGAICRGRPGLLWKWKDGPAGPMRFLQPWTTAMWWPRPVPGADESG